MPHLNISIPHELTQKEALRRIKGLLKQAKAQFGAQAKDLKETWSGNVGQFSFSAMGFSVSGTLTVKAKEVLIESKFPFAALPFKGKIESAIRKHATEALA